MSQKSIAVTGAGGFLGRAVVEELARSGWTVTAITRAGDTILGAHRNVAAGDLLLADLAALTHGYDALVNCAARVHVMQRESSAQAELLFKRANADFPLNLAVAAKAAGVRRFVQISSVAALVSVSPKDQRIGDAVAPEPDTPYGRAKLAADLLIDELADDNFRPISLRPPAVYGPGVEAYFAMLMRLANKGILMPLPTTNRRSFIYLENLASAIAVAAASERTGAYVVTDSEPISVADLYGRLTRLFGRGNRAVGLPGQILKRIYPLALGRRARSLVGDAAFDGTRFAHHHAWQPPFTLDDGLRRTVREFAS